MKLRTTALVLALTLSVSLLSACGPKEDQQPDASKPGSSVSAPDTSAPDVSAPDVSAPDASAPDSSAPDASQPEAPAEEQPAQPVLTLNKFDFTLFKAGDSYKLKTSVSGVEHPIYTWSSSNPEVATVSEDGTVTAVAPGNAVITVSANSASSVRLEAQCTVRCKFEADVPASGEGDSSAPENGDSSASSNVDLAAFYTSTTAAHQFGHLQLADDALLDNFYPGLTAVDTEQRLVYATMMSMNMGEFALIQVKDPKDVDTVKAILQARIDYMVEGGAWYPEPTRVWEESSRVVSNGSYIMMVIHEDCDAIVEDFNNLF